MENEEIESQQNTDDLTKKQDFDYYRQLFHYPCTCGGTYSTTHKTPKHEMPKYLTGQEKRRERRAKERELKRKKI